MKSTPYGILRNGKPSCRASRSRHAWRQSWSLATTIAAWEQPREPFWAAFRGSDASLSWTDSPGFHLQQNAQAYVPHQAMRMEVAADIRAMFNAPDRKTAEEFLQAAIQKYAVTAPRLSAWPGENLAEGLTVFDCPLEHRRIIRTTNSLERINKEIRRRTSRSASTIALASHSIRLSKNHGYFCLEFTEKGLRNPNS